jgi:hypothetical protein
VPRVISNPTAVHVHTCKNVTTPQSVTDNYENFLGLTQEKHSTGYDSSNGRVGEIPYRPITTQVLEHNLQQVHTSKPPGSLYASQHCQATILGASLIPAGDTIHGMTREERGCFHFDSVDGPSQTQGQQQERGSLFNEADNGNDSPSHQSTSLWQSQSLYQDIEMDMPGLNPDEEPTAWGNDFAGIGEHLAGYISQEYASHGELVVD